MSWQPRRLGRGHLRQSFVPARIIPVSPGARQCVRWVPALRAAHPSLLEFEWESEDLMEELGGVASGKIKKAQTQSTTRRSLCSLNRLRNYQLAPCAPEELTDFLILEAALS